MLSQKGRVMIRYLGFTHSHQSTSSGKARWICSTHGTKGCRAVIFTMGGKIIRAKNAHNHPNAWMKSLTEMGRIMQGNTEKPKTGESPMQIRGTAPTAWGRPKPEDQHMGQRGSVPTYSPGWTVEFDDPHKISRDLEPPPSPWRRLNPEDSGTSVESRDAGQPSMPSRMLKPEDLPTDAKYAGLTSAQWRRLYPEISPAGHRDSRDSGHRDTGHGDSGQRDFGPPPSPLLTCKTEDSLSESRDSRPPSSAHPGVITENLASMSRDSGPPWRRLKPEDPTGPKDSGSSASSWWGR